MLIRDGDLARIDRLARATSAPTAQFPGRVMPKFHAAAQAPGETVGRRSQPGRHTVQRGDDLRSRPRGGPTRSRADHWPDGER